MKIQDVISYLKAHWVTVLALAGVVWSYAAPTVQIYVQTHPRLSFWYGLAAVVVAFYLKSPGVGSLLSFMKPTTTEKK